MSKGGVEGRYQSGMCIIKRRRAMRSDACTYAQSDPQNEEGNVQREERDACRHDVERQSVRTM